MNISNKKNIFLKLYQEMIEIENNTNSIIDKKRLNNWREQLLHNLEDNLLIKVKKLELIEDVDDPFGFNFEVINKKNFNIVGTILKDQIFKYSDDIKSKKTLEVMKLIQARENNLDFDLLLSEMICGDNTKFPYKSSQYITKFFQDLGYNYVHNGSTRKYWVQSKIEEINTEELHTLISKGLFKKKYFVDYINSKKYEIMDLNKFFQEAILEFKLFIKNSLIVDDIFDLSNVLEMNINIELLNDIKPNTDDNELNLLIQEAIDRFYDMDKQVAIEKLWDAFERLKTHFSKDKKNSSIQLVKMISENFDLILIDEEFNILTKIGNNYRIRHHEIDKKELTEQHRNYFFFRMLSLIDLCLSFINKEEIEVDLF